MASNAQLGKIVLTIAISVFLYYFFWVAILPFMLIDEGNPLHLFFPPLNYAFIVPVVCGVIILGGIAIFTFYHIWNFRTSNNNLNNNSSSNSSDNSISSIPSKKRD